MALITCPECGEKVSDKAKACIHCGYPLEVLGIENTNVFKIILTRLPYKGNSKWRSSSEYNEAVSAVRAGLESLTELSLLKYQKLLTDILHFWLMDYQKKMLIFLYNNLLGKESL